MAFKKIISIILVAISAYLIFGCAEENENLVNPPSASSLIQIRVVNVNSDGKTRKLDFEGLGESGEAAPFASTDLKNPPADSTYVTVLASGTEEFTTYKRERFIRNIFYSYVPLPPQNSADTKTDTLKRIQSSSTIPDDSKSAFVKFFNAYPDTTVTFSVRSGCQNGSVLMYATEYGSQVASKEVRPKDFTFTLMRYNKADSTEDVVGLYKIDNLVARGQYALIVAKNVDNTELYLLDLINSQPLEKLEAEVNTTANLKIINIAKRDIDFKISDSTIVENLPDQTLSKSNEITVCASLDMDELMTYTSGTSNTFGNMMYSFEVLKDYTGIVYDSTGNGDGALIMLEPIYLEDEMGDNAMVRVVNTSLHKDMITVSLGARIDTNSVLEFRAGDIFAEQLSFGEVSDAMLVKSGIAPIAVFTGYDPRKLLYTSYSKIEAGKEYIVIITDDENGDYELIMIEDKFESNDQMLNPLDEGIFTQVMNALPGIDEVSISITNSEGIQIDGAIAHLTESLTTVIPQGQATINVNGIPIEVEAEAGKRLMIIAAGHPDDIDLLEFKYSPITSDISQLRRRYINASTGVAEMSVKINSNDTLTDPEVDYISYSQSSGIVSIDRDAKISMFFIDAILDEQVKHDPDAEVRESSTKTRIADISLPFGKGYTIIFFGDEENGYNAVIQQEF